MTQSPRIRTYKTRWFAKFAGHEGIYDAALLTAVEQAERGLIDADLGSGVIKQRVAREGGGKSGGYRTIIFFRYGERAIFAFGFAKSGKDNLTTVELKALRQTAKAALAFTQVQIDGEVREGRLIEVNDDGQDL